VFELKAGRVHFSCERSSRPPEPGRRRGLRRDRDERHLRSHRYRHPANPVSDDELGFTNVSTAVAGNGSAIISGARGFDGEVGAAFVFPVS
jgi:hypothetical protein